MVPFGWTESIGMEQSVSEEMEWNLDGILKIQFFSLVSFLILRKWNWILFIGLVAYFTNYNVIT